MENDNSETQTKVSKRERIRTAMILLGAFCTGAVTLAVLFAPQIVEANHN